MNNITILNKKDIFLLVLYGILGCSGLSRTIFQYMLGTLYLPEIFIVPLLFLLRKHLKNLSINYSSLYVFFTAWAVLLLLGILTQDRGSLFTIARAFLYLFLLYSIFKQRNNDINLDLIMYVCFGSLIGWVLCVFYNFTHPEIYINSRGEGYTYGNLMAIPFFLYTSFRKDDKKIFFIGLIIIIFLLFTAGLRRMMLVTAVSYLLVFLFLSATSKRVIVQTIIIISLAFIFISLNLKQIGDAVYEVSPATYYRVFDRVEESFNSTGNSDQERASFFDEYSTWQFNHILPSGFLKTYEGGNFGKFNDLPLLLLCYIFGMIILYVIIAIILYQWFKSYLKFMKYKSKYIGCFLVAELIVFMLIFLEGGFLTDPVQLQLTALTIGSITRISKYY